MAGPASRLQRSLRLRLPASSTPFVSTHRIQHASPRISLIRSYAADAQSNVEPPEFLSEGERKVFDMLRDGLQPTKLEVQDISGGCGSMYGIDVVSEKFKGMPVIKQHRLVNSVLGEEIKKWHGVQLKTKAP